MNPGESTTRSFPGLLPPSAPAGGSADGKSGGGASASWWRSHAALSPAERQLARVQQAVIFTMIALALLIAVRLWFVDGLLRAVRIEGPSMAGAFEGKHYQVICDDCRFPFRCDAHDVPGSGLVVCPNCGYRENKLEQATLQAGEQVLIDRWRAIWLAPRRGESVAARTPGSPDDLLVKRVAALPGETLSIRRGDLYANDQIVRKTPAEWRAARVLVHDNHYQPQQTKNLPPRWQSTPAEDGWAPAERGYRLQQLAAKSADPLPELVAELEFQPWRCTTLGRREQVVPVYDGNSYNQDLGGEFVEVRDVGLSCRLQMTEGTRLSFYVDTGDQRFEVELNTSAEPKARLLADGQVLATASLPKRFVGRPRDAEVYHCDEEIVFLLGRRTIFRYAYARPAHLPAEVCEPITLVGRVTDTGTISVDDLRVWRDIYYQHPLGLDRPWQADAPLPAGQYALLGDNPPVSIDSRNWQAGIPRTAMLGPVLKPFWRSR